MNNVRTLSLGGMAICIATVTACVETGITAYSQPDSMPGKRFILQGPDPRYPGGDPSWPFYARVLTKALEAKGYLSVESSPDLIIRVTYGAPLGGGAANAGAPSPSTDSLRTIQVEALGAASVASGKPTVAWSVRANTDPNEGDMASVFPYVVAAMEDYFGTNVPVEISVTKATGDPEVDRLMKP